MTDKSIQELAVSVGLPVAKLLDQVREAGLPQKQAEDKISTEQQDVLVNHLKKAHGQDTGQAGQITLKRKTTSTAKVASTSGKAKTINVEVRKKHTFTKPDPEQIKAEALAKAQANAQVTSTQKVQQNTVVSGVEKTESSAKANLEKMLLLQNSKLLRKKHQKQLLL